MKNQQIEHPSEWYTIRDALNVCDYIKSFPEDMNECRQSWDDMKDMVDQLRYGFLTLFRKHRESEEEYKND